MPDIIHYISLLYLTACVLYAAASDIGGMRISNRLCLVLAAGFFAVAPFSDMAIVPHVLTGVAVLAVCMGLFFFRLFGGGDAKLLPAVALWVGPHGLPMLLLVMTIFGGLLGGAALLLPKLALVKNGTYPAESWLGQLQAGNRVVPYGLAIASGAIASFLMTFVLQGGVNV